MYGEPLGRETLELAGMKLEHGRWVPRSDPKDFATYTPVGPAMPLAEPRELAPPEWRNAHAEEEG